MKLDARSLAQLAVVFSALLVAIFGATALAADDELVRPQVTTPCSSAAACQAWADNGWCEQYVGYIYTSADGQGVGCIRVCRVSSWAQFIYRMRNRIVMIDAGC